MPDPFLTVNGSIAVQQNEIFFSYKPFSGGEKGGVLEGLDIYVEPLIQPLLDLGYAVDYKKSKDYTSTLRYSGAFASGQFQGGSITPTNPNADFKDTWELLRNTVQKDLLESGHPLVAALDDTNLQELKNLINGTVKFIDNGSSFSATQANPAPGIDPSYDAAVYLWALYQSGVRSIEVKQPILRLTRTTNQLYDLAWSVANVDTLLSSQSMINDSGIPNTFAVPLISLASQIAAKTFTNPPYSSNNPNPPIVLQPFTNANPLPQNILVLEYAWLKEIVSAVKHGSQRIQYQIEYKFGLWDTKIYGYAS
jgi:hypothetical protein